MKIVNFRAVDAYKASDGKKIKAETLFRSAYPLAYKEYNDENIEFLEKKGINTIIDLRRFNEDKDDLDYLEEMPNDMRLLHRPIVGDAFIKQIPKKYDDNIYVFNYVFSKVFINQDNKKLLSRCMSALCTLSKEDKVLYHCYAGKDRTGMLTALLMMLFGCSKEDIYK